METENRQWEFQAFVFACKKKSIFVNQSCFSFARQHSTFSKNCDEQGQNLVHCHRKDANCNGLTDVSKNNKTN